MLIGHTRVSKANGSQASGGRPEMTVAKLRLARAATGRRETKVGEMCHGPGVTRQTLHRHLDPRDRLGPDGERLLGGREGRNARGRAADIVEVPA